MKRKYNKSLPKSKRLRIDTSISVIEDPNYRKLPIDTILNILHFYDSAHLKNTIESRFGYFRVYPQREIHCIFQHVSIPTGKWIHTRLPLFCSGHVTYTEFAHIMNSTLSCDHRLKLSVDMEHMIDIDNYDFRNDDHWANIIIQTEDLHSIHLLPEGNVKGSLDLRFTIDLVNTFGSEYHPLITWIKRQSYHTTYQILYSHTQDLDELMQFLEKHYGRLDVCIPYQEPDRALLVYIQS